MIRLTLCLTVFFSVLFLLSESVFAYSNPVKTPLYYVAPRFGGLPVQLKNIAYGLAGLATLGVGALGMFGKMSWPWVGSIIGSTALISGTYYYMQFIVK
jgi:hypothetical protein